MREHVGNLKIIQRHVAQNWRRKAVNLGFVIITFRTRSENASELKTTGTITPYNGVVFERSQVVSNFNIVFPT